jgi:hypothetical protein
MRGASPDAGKSNMKKDKSAAANKVELKFAILKNHWDVAEFNQP